MRRRIQPGWRHTLAQILLRRLFGWPSFTISPWPKAGVAVCVLLVNRNRILLARRRGAIEHAGCWSNIGGYVELDEHESFAQGAVREFFEETGCHLPTAELPPSPDLAYLSHDQVKLSEAKAHAVVGYYVFAADADVTRHFSPQEETSAFQWFTEDQTQAMIANRAIPADFTDLHQALAEVFGRIRRKEKFRPLTLA